VQKSAAKFSLRFFGIKTETLNSSLISSKWRNYQRGVLLIHAGVIQGHYILKEKHRGKVTEGGLVLHGNAPAHRALATHKKLAYLGFHLLEHLPYSLDLAPSDYHLLPGLTNN